MCKATELQIKHFEDYRNNHIGLVKRIGEVVFGKDFSKHDYDKCTCNGETLNLYALRNAAINKEFKPTGDLKKAINKLPALHCKSNPHHPEYFDDSITVNNFDDSNPPQVNASKMTKEAICELTCDWAAVAIKRNQPIFAFYNKTVASDNPRFLFTDDQKDYLIDCLTKIMNNIEKEHLYYPGITYNCKQVEPLRENKKLTENEEDFKKWFGDSKVVDSEGKPLIVYHGSYKLFDTFEPRTPGGGRPLDAWESKGYSYYFTSNKNVAKRFAHDTDGYKNIYSVYLRIENPLVVDYKKSGWSQRKIHSTLTKARENGNDGIIIKNIKEGNYGELELGDDYIVFSPNQIKSIDNNGNFSLESNNIYENREFKEDIKSHMTNKEKNQIGKFADIVADPKKTLHGEGMITSQLKEYSKTSLITDIEDMEKQAVTMYKHSSNNPYYKGAAEGKIVACEDIKDLAQKLPSDAEYVDPKDLAMDLILTESILDIPHKEYLEGLFEGDKLSKEVRDQITKVVNDWKEQINFDFNVTAIEAKGSLLSKRYNDTTDLDVSIITDMTDDQLKEVWDILPKGNNLIINGQQTDHPLDFYVIANNEVPDEANMDNIYDVLNNEWIKRTDEYENEIPTDYLISVCNFFINGCVIALQNYESDKTMYHYYNDLDPKTQQIKEDEKTEILADKKKDLKADLDAMRVALHMISSFRQEAYNGKDSNLMKLSINIESNNPHVSIHEQCAKILEKFGIREKLRDAVKECSNLIGEEEEDTINGFPEEALKESAKKRIESARRFSESMSVATYDKVLKKREEDPEFKAQTDIKLKDLSENYKYAFEESVWKRFKNFTLFEIFEQFVEYPGEKTELLLSENKKDILGWIHYNKVPMSNEIYDIEFGALKPFAEKGNCEILEEVVKHLEECKNMHKTISWTTSLDCPFIKYYINLTERNKGSVTTNKNGYVSFQIGKLYEKTPDTLYADDLVGVKTNDQLKNAFEKLEEKILKKGSKWQVTDHTGKKNLGTYDTKEEAEKRLKQVEYFKHMNEDGECGVVSASGSGLQDAAPEHLTKIVDPSGELLEEAKQHDTVVITFGRMNPPSEGHLKLANVLNEVPNSDKFIFLSHKQDPKTDPLPFWLKRQYVQEALDENNLPIKAVDTEKTKIIDILQDLYKQGYKNLIFVIGSDRFESMKFIEKYNNKFDEEGNGYNFNSIEFKSAGERDADSQDLVTSISASKLRQYVKDNDFENFYKGVAIKDKNIAEELFKDLKKYMGIEKEEL